MSSVDHIATILQSVFLMQYQSGPSGRHFLDSPSSNSLCADCRKEKPRLRQQRAEATKLGSKALHEKAILDCFFQAFLVLRTFAFKLIMIMFLETIHSFCKCKEKNKT